jgi:hypothetical protein
VKEKRDVCLCGTVDLDVAPTRNERLIVDGKQAGCSFIMRLTGIHSPRAEKASTYLYCRFLRSGRLDMAIGFLAGRTFLPWAKAQFVARAVQHNFNLASSYNVAEP